MVCESCQNKVSKLVVPDKWKDGSRSHIGSSSSAAGGGGSSSVGSIKVAKTNRALVGKKVSAQWKPENTICKICKSKLLHGHYYCNNCAHKKGICTMCGKKCADVKSHNMSLV